MGGTSKETVIQQSDPWGPAQPGILKGIAASTDTYDQNQPQLQKFALDQQNTYGRVAPGAEQGIMGAQNLVNRNLSGANLNGNPYLDAILGKTRADVTAGVNDQFGMSGRYGSGYHAKILTDELANAENQARFGNYQMERGYQQDAIGQGQQLMGGAQSLLNNAADLPWVGVGAMNGNVRQASNGYGTNASTKTSETPFNFGAVLGAAAQGAGSAIKFSDPRLKTNIEHVGTLKDGLGVYDFDYLAGLGLPSERQRGVMADEVAVLRPWALGPSVQGFATVHYGAL